MNLAKYMDSTYLKTPEQSGLSEAETQQKVRELTQEAINNHFFAVMIRPEYIAKTVQQIQEQKSAVKVGTVIGFHEGTYATQEKLSEAEKAIKDGADELDFVANYEKFKQGETDFVAQEIESCTRLALENGKVAKWIIEAAALSDTQIVAITQLIKNIVESQFTGKTPSVFVKSSTGFYQTPNGEPNGATPHNIQLMIENAGKLPVKAAGGVRSQEDAIAMIKMGVQRIGTSSAKKIVAGKETNGDY